MVDVVEQPAVASEDGADEAGHGESEVMRLSARHTESLGVRTYDLMHVGSALTLGCKRFWSFDAKASALAKLAGLETM